MKQGDCTRREFLGASLGTAALVPSWDRIDQDQPGYLVREHGGEHADVEATGGVPHEDHGRRDARGRQQRVQLTGDLLSRPGFRSRLRAT